MKWYDNIRKQVLGQRKQQVNPVFLKEKFSDSTINVDKTAEMMHKWGYDLLNDIAISYVNFLKSNTGTPIFHFIKQNGINGFGIELKNFPYSTKDWRQFQFFGKEKLKKSKYVVQLQEVTSKSDLGNLFTTFRYYLKPSIKLMTSIPSEQLFGNITLELILRNEKPYRLLLKANYYSDRNYKAEKAFIDIFETLKGSSSKE